jgi:hypothetical protein
MTLTVRSASEFIIGPRFARTRWRVSNHEAEHFPSFETRPNGRSSSDNGEAVTQG